MKFYITVIFSKARQILVAIITLLASIAVCLLVLEVGLRLWDGVPVFSTANFVRQELDRNRSPESAGSRYDPVLGWAQRADKSFDNFTTGQYGARMPSRNAVPLQQGAILVVGDSFAVGSDVADDESWPAQLEKALGNQVINAAIGGYAFDQTVLRAEQLVPVLHPKVLIVQSQLAFANLVNRMSMRNGILKPYFKVHEGRLVLQNSPVPRSGAARTDIGRLRSVFGHSYLVQFAMTRLDLLHWWVASILGDKVILSAQEGSEVACLLLHRVAQIRDRNNIKVLLMLQYGALEAMEPTLSWADDRSKFLDCAKKENLEVSDGLDLLQSVYRKNGLVEYQSLWVMRDHNRAYGHMSAEGNRLIANLIMGKLQGAD